MVAVIDQSGSMADCHCTGDSRDNANPSGTRGFEKVDIAKEAILRAAEALAPTDQLGVVGFNENAHWAVRTGPIDFGALGEGLDFGADGNTNIYAGLKAAYDDLIANPASLRHIILITDGWSTSGAYDELLDDMRAAGITLSTIGTGGGSAQVLRRLAEESGGRYYDAADATTIPDIFLRETIRTAGEQIVEETFQPIPSAPSEILEGLEGGESIVTTGSFYVRAERERLGPQVERTSPASVRVVVGAQGFQPARVDLPVGQPTEITFLRTTDQTCATEVVFADLQLRQALPLGEPVTVELPPQVRRATAHVGREQGRRHGRGHELRRANLDASVRNG